MANLKDLLVNGAARVIGKLYASEFVGKLTGNVTGDVTGNSSTATKLETARTIDGVSFNGSANVIHYSSCPTVATDAAKTVSCTGFKLDTGARIVVKFTVTNTASSPTLNVNSTGAKAIYYRGSAISAGYLAANRTYEFVYNGTQYELIGDLDTNSNTVPQGYCSTGESTAAKTVTCSSYSLLANSYLMVVMAYKNSVQGAITLNVNGKGAKPIFIDGKASSTTNYTLPAGSYLTYYDGTNYYFRTDGKITGSITGSAISATEDSAGNTISEYISSISGDGTSTTITYTKGDGTSGTFTTKDTKYTHPSHTAKSSGLYKITVDALGHVSAATEVVKADITGLGIPGSDTNTHYTATPILGTSTSTSNDTSNTSNPYLNIIENSVNSGGIQIKGSGATTVSAANGVLTISSTDNNTTYELVGANGTTGLVKNGSTVTSTSGYTACPIVSGVPYYKDTNTWRDVVDNLTTNDSTKSLSAAQGKVLNEKITDFDYRGKTNSWSAVNTFTSTDDVTSNSTTASGAIRVTNGGIWAKGGIRGNKVYNAVWNDLADCIPVNDDCELYPGYCYCFDGEKYYKSSKYLDDGIIGIHSDTYGIHMGSKPDLKQMDVAVSGFVLAYVDKEYAPGTPLTCTENGYLTEIKKSDKIEWPEKIVATYWKKELEEYWGDEKNKVKVNGRKWVKVK